MYGIGRPSISACRPRSFPNNIAVSLAIDNESPSRIDDLVRDLAHGTVTDIRHFV